MGTRFRSVLAAPAAPLVAAALAYRMYHPPRQRGLGPRAYDLPNEDLTIPVGRRIRLAAWLCPADPARVVVLGHPVGTSRSASLPYAEFLHRAGYTVCLFDFRNHGRSSVDRAWGHWRQRFTSDLVAVVRHLRADPRYGAARLALYGFSLSTYPVLASFDQIGDTVDAAICDGGPTADLPVALRDHLRARPHLLPAAFRDAPASTVLGDAFSWVTLRMLNRPRPWPPPARTPGLDTVPLLFLTGAGDRSVPPGQVRAVAQVYPHATLSVLPGAGHLRGLTTDPEGYREKVLGFLDGAFR